MEKRQLGQTDMHVSVLGFGGSEIGYSEVEVETVEKLLNAALDAGLNVIDTAECYRQSEEKIGATVSHRRNDYYLFTKCGHSSGFEEADWDPNMLAKTIDRSLQRLKTDYLDLVQLHSCGKEYLQQGDVVDVLIRAKEAGKTRYIGYSGDGENAAYALGLNTFDAWQTSISIADQQNIHLNLPVAKAKNVGVIVKRPIANVAWKEEPKEGAYSREYWQRLQKLDYPFLQGPLTESISLALRYTLGQTGVHTAIVGTTVPGRWKSNAALLNDGPVPESVLQEIRERWSATSDETWVALT